MISSQEKANPGTLIGWTVYRARQMAFRYLRKVMRVGHGGVSECFSGMRGGVVFVG